MSKATQQEREAALAKYEKVRDAALAARDAAWAEYEKGCNAALVEFEKALAAEVRS